MGMNFTFNFLSSNLDRRTREKHRKIIQLIISFETMQINPYIYMNDRYMKKDQYLSSASRNSFFFIYNFKCQTNTQIKKEKRKEK